MTTQSELSLLANRIEGGAKYSPQHLAALIRDAASQLQAAETAMLKERRAKHMATQSIDLANEARREATVACQRLLDFLEALPLRIYAKGITPAGESWYALWSDIRAELGRHGRAVDG